MFKTDHSFSSAVAVPFPVGIDSIVCDGSLVDCLCKLFPDRKRYFENQDPGRMSISALPRAPFGVSPDVLAGFFFEDMEGALRWAIERFGLSGITVVGLSEFSEKNVKGVVYRRTPPRSSRAGIPKRQESIPSDSSAVRFVQDISGEVKVRCSQMVSGSRSRSCHVSRERNSMHW